MGNEQISCIVVNYHYVRDTHLTPYPGINGLSVNKFQQQLDYLCRNYEMIDPKDYFKFLRGEQCIPRKSCLLTFDDGLKDHYETVFPILVDRSVTAVFFLITEPLVGGGVAKVHQIHFLMAKLGQESFREEFFSALDETFPDIDLTEFKGDAFNARTYRYDNQDTARLKRLLNYGLPYEVRDSVIESLFAKYFDDEQCFCRSLYMTWDEIREMKRMGLVFGRHTHTHPVLSRLGKSEQLYELKTSRDIITDKLGDGLLPFSYPYGGGATYSKNTIALLKKLGYAYAFTMIRGINYGNGHRYRLKRMDTNDIVVL